MLEQGFESTKDQIEEIRREVEIDRLKLLDERNNLEIKTAELQMAQQEFEKKKEEHPELLGAAAAGLAAA